EQVARRLAVLPFEEASRELPDPQPSPPWLGTLLTPLALLESFSTNGHGKETPLYWPRWRQPRLHLHPGQLAVLPVGSLQRHDRRDGQAFSGRTSSQQSAICLGAICTLSRL